jgi:molybdate transport system regulatory protein
LNENIKIPLPKTNIENKIKEDIKVRFITSIPYFGPGVADLLEAIEQKQSVSLACKKMGMSYSKGWKIIQKIKAATDFDAVTTQKGGNSGGLTELTPYGKKLLTSFRQYEGDVKEYSKERFNHYLSNVAEVNDEQ